MKGIRAVVFDIYGTLFSSGVGDISLATEQNRDAALKRTLSDNGYELADKSTSVRFDDQLHHIIKCHQQLRRDGGIQYPEVEIRSVWQELIESLLGEGLISCASPKDSSSLAIDYESRVNPTQPMPGLSNCLAGLKDKGMILSIISNAQFYTPLLFETYLDKTLKALGFCTACAVWSYKELEGKPSQALYRLSAKRIKEHHDIAPEEVLYVGNDMRNDIWPAQAIGYQTALFAGDRLSLRRRTDDIDCGELQPDLEITSLMQILDCLS
ncbi:HAD family hydrolase [Coraliomargarita parva]|uniref:HAD family hydrolase n=1 Tax=Coraliomargarita parva TaxID=3014050 RepID=UPI0022B3A6FD|nr:HAD family hydrolase [Coraliomargarita parva]